MTSEEKQQRLAELSAGTKLAQERIEELLARARAHTELEQRRERARRAYEERRKRK